MKILGIKFAPLMIPVQRRQQTASIAFTYLILEFGALIGILLLYCMLFYFNMQVEFWLYLLWAYKIDVKSCETSERMSQRLRELPVWKYAIDYFPIKTSMLPWPHEIDRHRNYLFCCFPHGILPMGASALFLTNFNGVRSFFPHHTGFMVMLKQYFYAPMLRELLICLGGRASSFECLDWILGHPDGGRIAGLVVGGSQEVYKSFPGQYRLFLKRRKGFVRLALKHGTPLVPVLSFGETDLFDQLDVFKNKIGRQFQVWYKRLTGFPFIIPVGRGIFQYSFGILPQRHPINVIIGKPLDVPRNEYATPEDVDKLHKKFVDHLVQFFEEEKHKYIKDADDVHLVIE